jgi:hypothetical protein
MPCKYYRVAGYWLTNSCRSSHLIREVSPATSTTVQSVQPSGESPCRGSQRGTAANLLLYVTRHAFDVISPANHTHIGAVQSCKSAASSSTHAESTLSPTNPQAADCHSHSIKQLRKLPHPIHLPLPLLPLRRKRPCVACPAAA